MQADTDTADLYQALIMERVRAPHHAGTLDRFDAEAEGDNPMCGDRVHLQLARDGSVVSAVAHQTRGCAICVSAADLMSDVVIGKSAGDIDRIAELFETMIVTGDVPDHAEFATLRALSGVHDYRSRHRCATLPWQALQAALRQTTEHENG